VVVMYQLRQQERKRGDYDWRNIRLVSRSDFSGNVTLEILNLRPA
jgi:hypothetical protein